MPRRVHAGALLVCSALLFGTVFAQQSAQNTAAPVAHVQHLLVRGTGDAMEVEIQTSGEVVAPDTQVITGPDRIVVDFPGAIPAEELRALKVNQGALKGVRSGLFFKNPPITRVVLDLTSPQAYSISTNNHSVIVKLGAAGTSSGMMSASAPPVARLQNAAVTTGRAPGVTPKLMEAVSGGVSNSSSSMDAQAANEPAQPIKPAVTVNFENGMLRIHAERATLAQVLYEVQRQTHAEIAIPAGAEQEQVFTDIGPGAARDVLGSLLNGSAYNFIFVGTEDHLQQVLLTRRDSSPY